MGEVFAGRYELIDPVAQGGMGTIWRVRDQRDGQVLVAKILAQSDAASLLRFVREQSVRIDHQHVVTPLGWAGMDDRVLFTMPLVRGGSVADLLREHGALPAPVVAELTDQLLQALEAVHAAGIVHRDVKPANLLLEPTPDDRPAPPHLRLTDFGIAVPDDEPRLTRAATAIGTPGYMPPEQWYGADPDPRADLFATGRVVLEMLTGRRPSPEEEPDVDALRTGDPAHDALLDVAALATRRAVAERPESAAALRASLRATGLLDGDPAARSVAVRDRYLPDSAPLAAAQPTAAPGRSAYPPPPPPPAYVPATPLAPTVTGGVGTPGRPSVVPGAVLVALGLVGLVVSLLLLV